MDANSRDELIDKLNDKAGQARETVEETAADVSAGIAGLAEDVKEKEPRYLSPAEVRKRKGCIGCGGAVIAITTLVIALVALL